jgi:hypothetical protein
MIPIFALKLTTIKYLNQKKLASWTTLDMFAKHLLDVVIIDKADFDKCSLGVAPVVESIKVRGNS